MGITGSGVGVFVGVGNGIGVPACPEGNGYLAEPCRGGSNGNQRKMVRGQNHQKSLKATKTTKTNNNHQNLVEMKRNGKGYLRGTVVDLMETTGKW